jgi:tRNA threonylcarbamoyladenosine biosynthesis protein TsaE
MSTARTANHHAILGTRTVDWPDEAACAAWAQRCAHLPALREAFMALEGPLGAGKTTFVRHLLRALGVVGRIKSPTFAVMEPYRVGDLDISHFDFYRFDDPREWDEAGFRDVFGRPGLKIAEWPDRVGNHLPVPDLKVSIELAKEERRRVSVQAQTARGLELLDALE